MTELEKETEVQWVKHDSSASSFILGKDIVVLSSDNYITFVETSRLEKKDILYNANSEVRGDGIQCICTHKSLPCFAFAERCREPRIFIMSYPTFEAVKTFDSATSTNYVTLRFSEMEFLVALTGVPDFKIIVWNWRTAEKLYCQETKLQSVHQIIRISPTSPVQIIQSTTTDKELIFWEMNLCFKKTLLQKFTLLLPESSQPPYCFAYGADGDIYVVDYQGCLYSINSETRTCNLQYAYTGKIAPRYEPCVTWYKGGIVFATPTDVIFLRRKSPEGWAKIWSFTPKIPFKNLMASTLKDLLIGVSKMNEIVILKGENQIESIPVRYYGADFDFVCIINPVGDFFVTFGNYFNLVTVWSKINGQKVSQMNWSKGYVNAFQSNPRMPYIVAVTSDGSVAVINVYDSTHPMEFDDMPLTPNSLDAIRFRTQGDQFCVANMDVGEFFLLRVPAAIEVAAYVKIDLKVVDYAILDKEIAGVFLLIVPMSQFCCRSGQTLLLYGLEEKQKKFVHLKDVTMPFVVSAILSSILSPRELFCVPHRSRKCFTMNIINGKMLNEFVTGHQMKFLSLQSDREYLFTFSLDGLVIVKFLDTKQCATLFSSHHRIAKGIKILNIDPYVDCAITLGKSGCLVCIALKKIVSKNRREELEELMTSPAFKQLFLTPALGERAKAREVTQLPTVFFRDKENRPLWLHKRTEEINNLAEQQSRKEKQNVVEEFYIIKKKLRQLLDENFYNLPERQLPVQAFDLDKAGRRRVLEDAKAEREKEKQFQQAAMKSYNKITDIIKKICWDSVAVKGREIHGILAPIAVQSYALFPENKNIKQKNLWLMEMMKIRKFFDNGDFFEPWVPRTDSELELHINNKFQLSTLDVTQTIKTKYEEEQMEDENTKMEAEDNMSKYIWSGTSSHNFVDVEPDHYNQFELCSFYQSHHEIIFCEIDIKKLMLWFNKEFAQTFGLKEREMAFVFERNNRFRHIINELNFFNFSPYICKTQIYNPEWGPEEDPNTIMTVEDKEITVPMYMSPSKLELAQKKEAEAERLRQLLMADDFKERALIAMMDGVLEKLWEDEIKKDVPKPKCLIEKDPDNYTEEDLKAIKTYDEAVKFLGSERERYRKLLEAEWYKTILVVKDSVSRFDEKVAKLHLLKLKVESAIGQEILKCMRIQHRCFERSEINRRIEVIKANLLKNEKKMESMNIELTKLQEMQSECKNVYENLQNKDKNLDKNFKKEFPEHSPIICEQLHKISKKRPKLLQKAAAYSTVLNDMGKCAVSGMKPEHMPTECIQYLKDLDALDALSNAPTSVNQQSWELACRLRRQKIEAELKIRACAIDLADAEATVANYIKSLKAAKDYHSHLQNELQTLRDEKLKSSLNYQIQLVLKKGLVELPLTGHISDFDECILVTKDTLNEVNKAIHKMGKQKLKAMQKAANFRKGILYKEWEHKKLRMEIEDLKTKLDTVEKLQVLKELQAILVARARGLSDEKGFLYLENELTKVKEKFEKAQVKIFSQMDEIILKIETLDAQNRELDNKIVELNVEVNEMNLSRDLDFDKKQLEKDLKRMKQIRERSRLVRKIQEQHNEILVLQTELELLRLKTYPTIKYKIS